MNVVTNTENVISKLLKLIKFLWLTQSFKSSILFHVSHFLWQRAYALCTSVPPQVNADFIFARSGESINENFHEYWMLKQVLKYEYKYFRLFCKGATIRYPGGARKIWKQEIIHFTSKWREHFFFHVHATPKYLFNIFCNGRYTWRLAANIFFTTCEEEFIFFTIFEEEFIYFKILPSPPPPWISNGRP